MEQEIKKILEYAIYAPSGDNSQPWQFKISNNILKIYAMPEVDNQILNYKDSATLIANGALIENIKITSSNFGYQVNVVYGDLKEEKLMAEINFIKDEGMVKDELFSFIKERHTNRYKYENFSLETDLRNKILEYSKDYSGVEIKIAENTQERKILATAAANAEIVILENQQMHQGLFENITWSKNHEEKIRHGLYINAMGFNPIQKIMFSLASNWSLMKFAIKCKLPKFIANEDSVLYASGSAICLITTKNQSVIEYINVGRVFQKIWLTVEKAGLVLQPITATVYLGKIVEDENLKNIFEQKHIDLIKNSFDDIKNIFQIQDENMCMMCRMGKCKIKAVSTSRFDLKGKVIN